VKYDHFHAAVADSHPNPFPAIYSQKNKTMGDATLTSGTWHGDCLNQKEAHEQKQSCRGTPSNSGKKNTLKKYF